MYQISLFLKSKKSPGEKFFERFLFIIGGLLLAMSIVLATSAANAQQVLPTVTALQKGDTFPDLTLTNLVNTKSVEDTIQLKRADDRLTVLIFFGTWCSSCRSEFPSHQTLQNRFKEKLRLIIVSDENRAKLTSFFSTARFTDGTPYTFPCVAEDKQLKALFPHRFIPHLVWIKAGKVLATTNGEELNEENITTVLQGSSPIYLKKDIDPEKPLFFNDDLPPSAIYSLFIRGQIDGLSSGGRFRRSGGVLNGRLVHNWHLSDMYQHAAAELMPDFNAKRVLFNIKDSSGFFNPVQASLSDARENSCSYEIRVPVEEADSLYSYMLQDLNRYTPYHGSIEKRQVKCFVLTVVAGYKDRLKTKGEKAKFTLFRGQDPKMVNYSTQVLLINLNELDFVPLPVVDETDLTANIDLSFSAVPTNLAQLKAALLEQGLKLSEKVRELEMLCIRDDK